jgi:hypothetical protein
MGVIDKLTMRVHKSASTACRTARFEARPMQIHSLPASRFHSRQVPSKHAFTASAHALHSLPTEKLVESCCVISLHVPHASMDPVWGLSGAGANAWGSKKHQAMTNDDE